MELGKKCSLMFLTGVNIMSIAAGIIVQLKILLGKDVTSIIPISINASVIGVLVINFLVVISVITLINIVTTYLVTDIAYSPLEIMQNFAGVFLIIPLVISLIGVYNAVVTPVFTDKIWIAAASLVFLLFSAVNVCCMLTIKQDAQ